MRTRLTSRPSAAPPRTSASRTATRPAADQEPARQHPQGGEPVLYSVEEAAGLLGIGRTFMFRLIGTGQIQSLKIGKRRKIPSDALRDYITRLLHEQSGTGHARSVPCPGKQARPM
jgi:excisionase family DNA binding protein